MRRLIDRDKLIEKLEGEYTEVTEKQVYESKFKSWAIYEGIIRGIRHVMRIVEDFDYIIGDDNPGDENLELEQLTFYERLVKALPNAPDFLIDAISDNYCPAELFDEDAHCGAYCMGDGEVQACHEWHKNGMSEYERNRLFVESLGKA